MIANGGRLVSGDNGAKQNEEDLTSVYGQLCDSYRAIDDFRAKLLGLLPLASGTGIFLLLGNVVTDPTTSETAKEFLLPIGIFGFLITLGLYLYELHGILKCDHLIKVGQQLERRLAIPGQFQGRPHGVAGFINEPFAARIIYPAVLAAWTFLALVFTWPQADQWAAIGVFVVFFAGPRFLKLDVALGEPSRRNDE
jgi:hypothetical protein